MEEGTLLLFVAPVSVFPAIPDSNSVFSFFLFCFFFFLLYAYSQPHRSLQSQKLSWSSELGGGPLSEPVSSCVGLFSSRSNSPSLFPWFFSSREAASRNLYLRVCFWLFQSSVTCVTDSLYQILYIEVTSIVLVFLWKHWPVIAQSILSQLLQERRWIQSQDDVHAVKRQLKVREGKGKEGGLSEI